MSRNKVIMIGGAGGGTGTPTGSTNDLQTNAGGGNFGHITPATGVATLLVTPSSANLAAAITDETGTGALVFANTPTLVSPALGAATGTSITLTGAVVSGSGASTAGAVVMGQGTTQSTGTTNITMQAPTGVTSYIITLPTAVGATGLMQWTVSGSVATLTSVTQLPSNITVDGTNLLGYRGAPQQSKSVDYTLVLGDAGFCVFHPVGDNNARAFTIPANASVAYPVGTIIEFLNMAVASCTIPITTDTLTLLPAGTTGTRTLAQYGRASAEKITSTSWIISGNSALT